jgi:hypothetical protein
MEVAPAQFCSAEDLKRIASEAGAAVAKDTIARIHAGDISKDDDACAHRLAAFVFECCDDLRAEGRGIQDILLFREACVRGFREVFSAFRVGLATSESSQGN